MPFTVGTRVGPYEVTALLGQGGMGEVYRATDTRLKRQVAIKILPASFGDDPDRLARFQREAEVLASLNHPNIAAIYGLEGPFDSPRSIPGLAQGGPEGIGPFLVLELVEGLTLAEVIDGARAKGGLPLDDALSMARQIADALAAAHGQGIVHRDLKPANIKVRPDGTIKVLDFGLAKALESDPASSTSSHAPTLTSPAMTRLGVILGTAAYMSPEQARGKPADKRADIWAFGVVLFEMLSGTRLFTGSEVSDTLAFVLTKDPDWSQLPPSTPAPIRTLLRRCLQKDRTKRLADIADARLEIDDVLAGTNTETQPTVAPVRAQSRGARLLPWAVAGAAASAAVVMLGLWAPWRSEPVTGPVRFSASVGAPVIIDPGQGGSLAVSPDGSMVAFVGRAVGQTGQLYVRRLGELEARAIPGTDGAAMPFFSPDGQWVAFFDGASLKKVTAAGGAVVTLCGAPTPRGGWWGEDGTVFFSILTFGGLTGGQIMRVSEDGGEPEAVTTPGKTEFGHLWPQALPGNRGVLYTAPQTIGQSSDALVMVQPLPAGPPKVVHRGGTFARYWASGHLTYVRDGTLFGAPFNLESLELTGPPAPLLEGFAVTPLSGGAVVSASSTGTLAYLPGSDGSTAGRAPILWLDRAGALQPLRAEASAWGKPRFSPDGRRLALTISDGRQNDIWVYDLARDTLQRLTSDPENDMVPVWSPDGGWIAFGSTRAGTTNLYAQRADGTGEVQRLTNTDVPQLPDSWHPSGRFLAFHEGNPLSGQQRLMMLPLEGDAHAGWKPGAPTEFVAGPFIKAFPTFSPDGRWVAYVTAESGDAQVWVQPFPGPGGRWQISNDGANQPMWSRTRPELFYVTGAPGVRKQQIIAVPYSVDGDVFKAARPEVWSDTVFSDAPIVSYGPSVDLHPDGDRFAVAPAAAAGDSDAESRLVFVINFFDELTRQRTPER